ncbi:MAG: hypothetical protein K2X84_01345, partial [Beijerinckiaceae bacterium]|nr:hypothetical protein [Beijerinckiaceae bacterium]
MAINIFSNMDLGRLYLSRPHGEEARSAVSNTQIGYTRSAHITPISGKPEIGGAPQDEAEIHSMTIS